MKEKEKGAWNSLSGDSKSDQMGFYIWKRHKGGALIRIVKENRPGLFLCEGAKCLPFALYGFSLPDLLACAITWCSSGLLLFCLICLVVCGWRLGWFLERAAERSFSAVL